MLDNLEGAVLAILKAFSPKERESLKFGGTHWLALFNLLHIGKTKFTLEDLIQYGMGREKKINTNELISVLRRLEENHFITKDTEGFYKVPTSTVNAFNEFFGFAWRPRKGKTGFLKYLIKSKKRMMLWYCLYINHPLNPREAAQLTGYSFDECRNYLQKFEREKWLTRVGIDMYKVADEEGVFQELISKYQIYCVGKPTIRDIILEFMTRREKVSGREIREHLNRSGIDCDPTTVYKHLRKLENEGVIGKTEDLRHVRGGTYEKYYELYYEDAQRYKGEIMNEIRNIIKESGLEKYIQKEFFDDVLKQKPHVLKTFFTDLEWLILQHEDHAISLEPLLLFIENLSQDVVSKILSELSSVQSDKELIRKLERLSREFKMSPLMISLMYLFKIMTESASS